MSNGWKNGFCADIIIAVNRKSDSNAFFIVLKDKMFQKAKLRNFLYFSVKELLIIETFYIILQLIRHHGRAFPLIIIFYGKRLR